MEKVIFDVVLLVLVLFNLFQFFSLNGKFKRHVEEQKDKHKWIQKDMDALSEKVWDDYSEMRNTFTAMGMQRVGKTTPTDTPKWVKE